MTSIFQPLRTLAAAPALIAMAFAAAPAEAAEGGSYYRAELVQPAAHASVIIDGIAWRCDGSACLAPKGNSRDAIVCARLVKKVGQVTSFASRSGALESADLARCNDAA